MSKSFRIAARLVLLLAVVLGTFASSVTPASAAISQPPSDLTGRLGVYTFDNNSIGKGPIYAAAVTVYDMNGGVALKGSTNKSGWFGGEVKAGKYIVVVTAVGYKGEKEVVGINQGEETNIKCALDRETVDYKGVLTLRVWDAPSPAPMPKAGAFVVVKDATGIVVAKGFTTKTGLFTVTLNAGAYRYVVTADGYKPIEGECSVVANQEIVADLLLEKEVVMGEAQIAVFDGNSTHIRPLGNAVILVYNADGQLITKGITDDAGKYGTLLRAGIYKLEVSAAGYQTTVVSARIDPGVTNATVVRMMWEPKN